jgi:hypothetical protein
LAKTVGLDRRWAFLFVIVNALTFGNSCFSFYRYYGLSTSIYAQLGAVALTRIVLEWAKGKGGKAKSKERRAKSGSWRLSLAALQAALRDAAPLWIGRLALCALLLAFIAFNHVQGIGIAGLSVAAICIWRLVEWKRSALWWLLGTALILSVTTILWYPRNPIIDSVFRPGGWLNAWYGFDLFSPRSSASDRMMQIIGIIGFIDLFAGAALLRRNHLIGWLTLTPIFALTLPFIAIPFAESISVEIVAYHRMFFAIPPNLAIVLITQRYCVYMPKNRHSPTHLNEPLKRHLPSITIGVCLCTLVLVPTIDPWFSRTWQVLAVAPTDLTLQTVVEAAERSTFLAKHGNPPLLVSTEAVANIFNTVDPTHFMYVDRRSRIGEPITQSIRHVVANIFSSRNFSKRSSMTADPSATEVSHWISLTGAAPQLVTNINDLSRITTALQSRRGQRSDIFTSELIPIDSHQTYRTQLSIIQRSGKKAVAYLALAWYDQNGRLLESNVPSPSGAGNPSGWANGTYSYFGLINNEIPDKWTTYRRVFGSGETATIPSDAKYVRIGALLNYGYAMDSIVQLTNVKLWREQNHEPSIDVALSTGKNLLVVMPKTSTIWTYSSQAALASNHWPTNQVASDLSGALQIEAAAWVANANFVGPTEAIIDPKE